MTVHHNDNIRRVVGLRWPSCTDVNGVGEFDALRRMELLRV